MGRELRRVPLDFDWPLNKVWQGFINPHWRPCPGENVTCWNGYTGAGQWFDAICRFLALVASQAVEEPHAEELRARGQIFPHPYLEQFQQAPHFDMPRSVREAIRGVKNDHARSVVFDDYLDRNPPKLVPFTEELVTFFTALAGEKPSGGMASGNLSYRIREKLLAITGMPERFGICPICEGDRTDPAVREIHENWKEEAPPVGDGYQLWETTSEGSPVSPVFQTLDELCAWCETNETTFADLKTSKEEWRRMLDQNFVSTEMRGTDPDGKPVTLVFI